MPQKVFCAAVTVFLLGLAPALAQDVEKGARVFRKCQACHMVGEGARNKVGPQLNALWERVAGGLEDYKYSKAMIAAGQEGVPESDGPLVWNDVTLMAYLAKPRSYVKGTKMAFAGLRRQRDLDNILAYLRQFDPKFTPQTEDSDTQTTE